jgi:hypothetical protein
MVVKTVRMPQLLPVRLWVFNAQRRSRFVSLFPCPSRVITIAAPANFPVEAVNNGKPAANQPVFQVPCNKCDLFLIV